MCWKGLRASACVLVIIAALTPVTGVPENAGGVEIIRDRWGIAHVYAGDEESLFYGAGYAMAEDRLLQMTRRRAAQGRLAEILGAGPEGRFIKADRRARILGFYETARRQLPRLSVQNRRSLESFAAGSQCLHRRPPRLAWADFCPLRRRTRALDRGGLRRSVGLQRGALPVRLGGGGTDQAPPPD